MRSVPGFLTLFSVFIVTTSSCTKEVTDLPVENRVLTICNDDEFEREVDVTGWTVGDVVELSGYDWNTFYYPWQGEDTIDYRIEEIPGYEFDAYLWVNSKRVGVKLYELDSIGERDLDGIVTISTMLPRISSLPGYPNLQVIHLLVFSSWIDERQHKIFEREYPELRAKIDSMQMSWNKLVSLSENVDVYIFSGRINDVVLFREEPNDRDIIRFSKMQNLKGLEIYSSETTKFSLRLLKRLMGIKKLQLSCSGVDNRVLRRIRNLTNLKELKLSAPNSTGMELKSLEKLRNLRVLELDHLRMGDNGLKNISRIKSLQEITLRECHGNTLRDFLWFCENLISSPLNNFEYLPGEFIALFIPPITSKGWGYLSDLSRLRRLVLRDMMLWDEDLIAIGKLSILNELDLSNAYLSADGLMHLCNLKDLQVLRLPYVEIEPSIIEELQEALPNCTVDYEYWTYVEVKALGE